MRNTWPSHVASCPLPRKERAVPEPYRQKPTISISDILEAVCMFFDLQPPLISKSSSPIVSLEYRERFSRSKHRIFPER
ncbi:hypothetical protein HA466_0254340 [Hirschfeldia incana]|nr:hypothetical protein HA466_0254340 [Hirschfeldia incana]